MDALSALYSLVYELAVCRDTNRSDDVAGQWTQAPSYFSDVSFLFSLLPSSLRSSCRLSCLGLVNPDRVRDLEWVGHGVY